MNKSYPAAIAAMLLVTSAAWATPEGQAIRPMGDNQPDPSPTEQADQVNDPVPMDEERVKEHPRQDRKPARPENPQESLKEYNNPEAAGDDAGEELED
ncbi:hypothetical protein ACFOZ5_02175 [Marinobacter lacisalsi]|uniref:Secreted protein n=1 Tax=Marinobacter lacisalsi TaxID=475979 RepID=A0ABV8QFJ1_9GAMM